MDKSVALIFLTNGLNILNIFFFCFWFYLQSQPLQVFSCWWLHFSWNYFSYSHFLFGEILEASFFFLLFLSRKCCHLLIDCFLLSVQFSFLILLSFFLSHSVSLQYLLSKYFEVLYVTRHITIFIWKLKNMYTFIRFVR